MDLLSRPCIMVEGIPHCFRCAKAKVRELEDSFAERERERFDREQAEYLETERRYLSWIRDRDFELDNGSWDRLITAAVVGLLCAGVFSIMFNGTLKRGLTDLLEWVIGFVGFLWFFGKRVEWARAAFERDHPEPPKPKPTRQPSRAVINYELVKDFADVGTWRGNYRVRILLRDNNTCQNCGGQPGDEGLEVHHIQTRADNGPDHPANLVTLCHSCHDLERWFGHVRAYPKTLPSRQKRSYR